MQGGEIVPAAILFHQSLSIRGQGVLTAAQEIQLDAMRVASEKIAQRHFSYLCLQALAPLQSCDIRWKLGLECGPKCHQRGRAKILPDTAVFERRIHSRERAGHGEIVPHKLPRT